MENIPTRYLVFACPVMQRASSMAVIESSVVSLRSLLERVFGEVVGANSYHIEKLENALYLEVPDADVALDLALALHDAHIDQRPIRLRIGVDMNLLAIISEPSYGTMSERDGHLLSILRAKRIMELCQPRFVLCSSDLMDNLKVTRVRKGKLRGPFAVKLKDIQRPILVYSAGSVFPVRIERWQRKSTQLPKLLSLGPFRGTSVSDLVAQVTTTPLWSLFRNRARYSLGKRWFHALHTLSLRVKWWRLQLHTSIGLADVSMLLREPEESLNWTREENNLARKVDDKYYIAMGNYSIAHQIAHAGSFIDAEGRFRSSYASFEDYSDARMAGWSAQYLGRCLRVLRRWQEAEDWILTSVLLAKTINHKRQIAYALSQLARLRADENRFENAAWFLEKARRIYPEALGKASDDAVGDFPLEQIIQQTAGFARALVDKTVDPARDLVEWILA